MATMINDAGGMLGRKIEIVSRDDESTPAVGVSRATELAAAGVAVVIKGWNSPLTLAMQPVLARAGILDITAISKADVILSGEANPMAVRLNSSNSQDGAVIANYIVNIAKARRIAFLTQNDAYGNGAQASIALHRPGAQAGRAGAADPAHAGPRRPGHPAGRAERARRDGGGRPPGADRTRPHGAGRPGPGRGP